MTTRLTPPLLDPEPANAATALARLGFLANSDVPDRPGPAYLLVALRPAPTLRHFDPERVQYPALEGRDSVDRVLTNTSRMPFRTSFAPGRIEVTDRLLERNDYLAFGGTLSADRVGDAVFVVFASPAPLYRMGGHSQFVGPGADLVGAHFARLRAAVSGSPDRSAEFASAGPEVAYAAFLCDVLARYGASQSLPVGNEPAFGALCDDARRLRRDRPDAWRRGSLLLERLGV